MRTRDNRCLAIRKAPRARNERTWSKIFHDFPKFFTTRIIGPKVTIRANCESRARRVERSISICVYRTDGGGDLCTEANRRSKKVGPRARTFVKLIGEKRGVRESGRLIVNCKQFRNCVDKAIKPFDRPCTRRGAP